MKKSRSFVGFIVVLIFVVAACATTAKYEKMLQSWRGSDVNALIEAWGTPQGDRIKIRMISIA